MKKTSHVKLRQERLFDNVLTGCLYVTGIFVLAFAGLTVTKARHAPQDITADWFSAWGQWAGGLATAEAFLITAASIAVASAHARVDRQTAAEIREDDEMSQARMLTVFRVDIPGAISGLNTFRIENRSRDYFFDVHVPFIEYPNAAGGVERRTPELVAAENRLHEWLPRGEMLTPYLSTTDSERWFTEAVVHTANWSYTKFPVEYTDAAGRRWRQKYGGEIERVLTNQAILVRDADRFQAPYQIRVLTNEEKRRAGIFEEDSLKDDDDFLDAVGPTLLATWTRVERVGQPLVRPYPHSDQNLVSVQVGYSPPPPPFWDSYFHKDIGGLSKAGGLNFSSGGGNSVNTATVRCAEADIPQVIAGFDHAIKRANDQFESNELAAAQRASDKRSAEAEATANELARLEELAAQYGKPGLAPWQRRRRTDPPERNLQQGPTTRPPNFEGFLDDEFINDNGDSCE